MKFDEDNLKNSLKRERGQRTREKHARIDEGFPELRLRARAKKKLRKELRKH
jgi:hypothetical protein